jgi:hypothetical protein
MAKCEVCGKEAEFESPADLCNYHWKLWWYTGLFEGIAPWDLPKDMSREERDFYLKVRRDGEFLEIEDTDFGRLITFRNGKIYN